MSIDRRWMYSRIIRDELSAEFREGVEYFINFALGNESAVDENGYIRCPCSVCKNMRFRSTYTVTKHLYSKGFMKGYMN